MREPQFRTGWQNHQRHLAQQFQQASPYVGRQKENNHLFTHQNLNNTSILIGLLANHDMQMILPQGILTIQNLARNLTRLDNVFTSSQLVNWITKCDTKPDKTATDCWPLPYSDHPRLPRNHKSTAYAKKLQSNRLGRAQEHLRQGTPWTESPSRNQQQRRSHQCPQQARSSDHEDDWQSHSEEEAISMCETLVDKGTWDSKKEGQETWSVSKALQVVSRPFNPQSMEKGKKWADQPPKNQVQPLHWLDQEYKCQNYLGCSQIHFSPSYWWSQNQDSST